MALWVEGFFLFRGVASTLSLLGVLPSSLHWVGVLSLLLLFVLSGGGAILLSFWVVLRFPSLLGGASRDCDCFAVGAWPCGGEGTHRCGHKVFFCLVRLSFCMRISVWTWSKIRAPFSA